MAKKPTVYVTRPVGGVGRPSSEYAERLVQTKIVAGLYADDFTNLACNSVVIENLPEDVPQDYIMQVLITQGAIAWYPAAKTFYQVSGVGRNDVYGYPTRYNLVGGNGKSFHVPASAIVLIKANPLATPIYPLIVRVSEMLAYIDTSIENNLIATQSTKILAVDDDSQVASVRAAYANKSIGCPAIVTRKDIAEAMTAIDDTVPYIADKLFALRGAYRDELLQHLGVLTANREKRERVQSAEVNAAVGEVVDYIYTLIDTANHDAERGGAPLRLRLNSSVEELYGNGVDDAEIGTENGVDDAENGVENVKQEVTTVEK